MKFMSNQSLLLTALLLLIPIFISYQEDLGLAKDVLIASGRATLQLFVLGFILQYIFEAQSSIMIVVMVLIIIFNAALNARSRNSQINGIFMIAFISISVGVILTLCTLLLTGALNWSANEVIPISGMLASNAMVSFNLCLNSMQENFSQHRQKVEEKLALGANKRQASKEIIRLGIQQGMSPQIDSARTVGLVALPGMMTGMLMAGADPLESVKYQLMITFMMISSVALSSIIATYLAYDKFYNDQWQI